MIIAPLGLSKSLSHMMTGWLSKVDHAAYFIRGTYLKTIMEGNTSSRSDDRLLLLGSLLSRLRGLAAFAVGLLDALDDTNSDGLTLQKSVLPFNEKI